MDDRRRARLGHVRGQPLADSVNVFKLARAVVFPESTEAAQLALEVAGRLTEALQPGGLPVDAMQLDQRID